MSRMYIFPSLLLLVSFAFCDLCMLHSSRSNLLPLVVVHKPPISSRKAAR